MPEVGRRIGAYKLEERLEAFHGTQLWRARRVDPDLSGPTVVCIRCIEDPDDSTALDRVRREHQDLRVLGDSRIPKVLGFYESQGALVLEDSPGTSLDLVLQAVTHGELLMDATTAVDLILEVAHALRHAHSIVRPEGKIVHGHLGPDRVVLTADGDVRILGVGATPDDIDPRYMPQELANRTGRDERTDQWQIGALLYELITRQPLYKGAYSEAWRAATQGDVAPALDRLESRYPALTQVLRKVLATQPSGRYQVESTFLRALLTASRSVSGKSRRRGLGAEASRIEPVMRPAVTQEPAEAGWSRVGASAESGGPVVFDPGDTGEQSDYELAEQNATDADRPGMAWVDLPEHDRTPLPDLFARPKPAQVRVPQAPRRAPPPPPINRPRAPVRRAAPMLAASAAPEPVVSPGIQVVDNLSLRADAVTVRTADDLPEARVDDLRSILGAGPPPAPRAGASVKLSLLRVEPEGTQPPVRLSQPTLADQEDTLDAASAHDLPLSPDLMPTVFARRPADLEPTALISGRKQVLIQQEWAAESPTDPGVGFSGGALSDPPTDLQVPQGAFGLERPPITEAEPLPEFAAPAPLLGTERIQWGLFMAASVLSCLTLWVLVYVG